MTENTWLTTDIVEWLRDGIDIEPDIQTVNSRMDAAADEIERLRDVDAKRYALFQARNDEIERLRQTCDESKDALESDCREFDQLSAEIERLSAALREIADLPTEQLYREPTRPAVIADRALEQNEEAT